MISKLKGRLQMIPAHDFDLEKTLNSGQVFHWEKYGKGFVGAIGDDAVYLEQQGGLLNAWAQVAKLDGLKPSSFRSARDRKSSTMKRMIARYFALDHPLGEICASFPRDMVMDEARSFCRGLRIIRQPKWECLATFICSSMKQVAHIRQISRALRRRYGKARKISDLTLHTFPTARRLAETSETDLRACALGYRAKNLLTTARLVASGQANLEGWAALPDEELRARLCELPGVGAKVANCVLLFAYERLGAFPIDVWIERVLREKYFARKRKPTARRLREFAQDYFGEHGGYAQQYLFHHARIRARDGGRRAASLA
jgi:N-glycosylase/DNA lyase